MSEHYTPTTEQVREHFGESVSWNCEPDRHPQREHEWDKAKAAFDRWLAEELRKARAEAWEECLDEVSTQGTVQLPDNPYREEQE